MTALIGRNVCELCKPIGLVDLKARQLFSALKQGDPLEVFTTRPDTLWGVTFMVLAPEHPLVAKVTTPEQKAAVDDYIQAGVAPDRCAA